MYLEAMSKMNSASVIAIDSDANSLRVVIRVSIPVIGTLAYEFVRGPSGKTYLSSVNGAHGRDPHRDGVGRARTVATATMAALAARNDARYPLSAALRRQAGRA
jgi:hypothetical protein